MHALYSYTFYYETEEVLHCNKISTTFKNAKSALERCVCLVVILPLWLQKLTTAAFLSSLVDTPHTS